MHSGPPAAVMAYLDVLQAGLAPPRVVPVQDEMVIGRLLPTGAPVDVPSAEGFLGIPEHTVSRRHARIRRQGGVYSVEDLHSVNGTCVNGERLVPGAIRALCDGDEVSVANALLAFHSLLEPASSAASSVITRCVDATRYVRMDALPPTSLQGTVRTDPLLSAAQLQSTVRKLHAMAQVGIALGAVTDRATLIEKIMNFIFELFPLAERAFILLLQNGEGGNGAPQREPLPLVADAVRRRDGGAIDPQAVRLSRTIVHEVLHQHQAILSVDTMADRHFGAQESILAQPIRSVMCVPLLLEDECLGLIQVDTSSDPQAFKEPDLEMLTGVCAEAAVTLKNFQLYSDIERLLDGFVHASVQAIEERDPVTAGHSFRVADYAHSLACAVDRADTPSLRKITYSREQLREIRYAALLHDFGKVGVREHVLRKEKKLHHAELRLLEERFATARAGLEAHAFRTLVERHARQALDHADFCDEKARVEERLQEEFECLKNFLSAIGHANEPTVSSQVQGDVALAQACAYRFPCGPDPQHARALLEPFEFAALSLARGCLTPDERRQIEAHVADSHAFLILIPWTRELAGVPAIAYGHHEKLDGSGYPRGLLAADIGSQTRILTICDIFDALTASDRPYKKAVPLAHALDLMQEECRAGHLDAALFEVFTQSQAWRAGQAVS